jgi:sRNA-binding regulator protein Hfq
MSADFLTAIPTRDLMNIKRQDSYDKHELALAKHKRAQLVMVHAVSTHVLKYVIQSHE